MFCIFVFGLNGSLLHGGCDELQKNKGNMSPWCGSYGGWQLSTCNPYCSHGGLVILHSLSLMNLFIVDYLFRRSCTLQCNKKILL
ncbi:hypothetical protein Hanom_Chr01g00049571 [Helianthus anomalus]